MSDEISQLAVKETDIRYKALRTAIAHCEAQSRLSGMNSLERTQVRALAAFYADFLRTGNPNAKTP